MAAQSSAQPLIAPRPARLPLDAAASHPALGGGFLALCILTFVLFGRPQDYVPALIPLRLALVFTVLTTVITFLGPGPTLRELFSHRETKLYFLFYAAMVMGVPFSYYRPGSLEAVLFEFPVNLVFFVLLLFHVDSLAKLRYVAIVLVLSIFLFTVMALQMGQFGGGRFFLQTMMFDPNDIAYVELSLFAYAFWMLVTPTGWVIRIAALISILAGILLTLYTASRGGLLGLISFLVLLLAVRIGRVRASFKVVMAVAIVVLAVANQEKINTERFMTITSLENDYNFEEGGRADLWKRGWRLFLRHPLTGVGVHGFAPAVGWMRVEEQASMLKWQVAHSAYITVLTETGIVGTVAFTLLVFRCLSTFRRLRRPTSQSAEAQDLAALAGLLFIGLVAQLVAAMFLSQAYGTFFTLVFALSAILNRLSAAPAAVAAPAPAPPAWKPAATRSMAARPAWRR